MRGTTAGLLLLGAAVLVGCGDRQSGAPARKAAIPEAVRSAAGPLAHAFASWRTRRPQHLTLSITHLVQPRERAWTGNIAEWNLMTARVARPLEAEAWVGKEDQVVIAPGNEQQLALHRSSGAPLLQVGPPPGSREVDAPLTSPRQTGWSVPPRDEVSLGWSAERMPDATMLGGDLARLLDLSAMAEWLEAVPTWSTALAEGGTQHRGRARALPGDRSWGAVRDLQVSLVLDHEGRWLRLTIEVRREGASVWRGEGNAGFILVVQPRLRGEASRWSQPFPFAQLMPPEELVERSVPDGHVVSDAAHERTVYVLSPAPGPISPALEHFLSARRVVR